MKLIHIFSRVLGIAEDQIDIHVGMENIPEWSSLNSLVIITEIEREFGVKFESSEILQFKSINDILVALEKCNIYS